MNSYSKITLKEIKDTAIRKYKAEKVLHIYPRAYCVAKVATHAATFVVPKCDSESCISSKGAISVHGDSVKDVEVGDWCSLAYVAAACSGEFKMIFIL
jgi:hypothetical protein